MNPYYPKGDTAKPEPSRPIGWGQGQDESQRTIAALREEIRVLTALCEARWKVMESIPGCDVRGDQCVPHALEWLECAKRDLIRWSRARAVGHWTGAMYRALYSTLPNAFDKACDDRDKQS